MFSSAFHDQAERKAAAEKRKAAAERKAAAKQVQKSMTVVSVAYTYHACMFNSSAPSCPN